MIVYDIAGKKYTIRPRNSKHVFVSLVHDEGMRASRLWLRRDDTVPDTRAIIEELPQDLSEIFKYEPSGLHIGETVVFLRYAERQGLVMWDYFYEQVEVLDEEQTIREGRPVTTSETIRSRRGIYALNVHDIVAVIREPQK